MDFGNAPFPRFWAAYFLPVALHADSATKPDVATSALVVRFLVRLVLMLSLFVLLDPCSARKPMFPQLAPSTLLGDALWALVVLLAASGMMDFAGAQVQLMGLSARESFRSPLLAASLQDFWGRRWNLTAVRTLRECAYRPALRAGAPRLVAMALTFGVSGAAHEAIVWYGSGSAQAYSEVRGRWFAFFIQQGVLVGIEVAIAERLWALGVREVPTIVRRLYGFIAVLVAFGGARMLFLPPAFTLRWPWILAKGMLAGPVAVARAVLGRVPWCGL